MELRTRLTARSIAYLCSSLAIAAVAVVGYQRYQEKMKTSESIVVMYADVAITEAQVQYQIELAKYQGSRSSKGLFSKFAQREAALEELKELYGFQALLQTRGYKIGFDEILLEQKNLAERGERRRLFELVGNLQGFPPKMYNDIFIRSMLVRRLVTEKLQPEFQKLNSTQTLKEWMQAELEKTNPSKPANQI